MYADDTTLTSSAEDPCVLERKMNHEMNLIQSWLSANKLTLNVNHIIGDIFHHNLRKRNKYNQINNMVKYY